MIHGINKIGIFLLSQLFCLDFKNLLIIYLCRYVLDI